MISTSGWYKKITNNISVTYKVTISTNLLNISTYTFNVRVGPHNLESQIVHFRKSVMVTSGCFENVINGLRMRKTCENDTKFVEIGPVLAEICAYSVSGDPLY